MRTYRCPRCGAVLWPSITDWEGDAYLCPVEDATFEFDGDTLKVVDRAGRWYIDNTAWHRSDLEEIQYA